MKCPVVLGVMDMRSEIDRRPVSVHGIEVDRLRTLLDDSNSSVLLIDSRPFMSYNKGHIREAHNVYCPPILRRRYGPNVPIDNILGCADSRKNLIEGRYSVVVVYDDATVANDGLMIDHLATSFKAGLPSHDLLLVLHSLLVFLSENANDTSLFYLNGGFDCFTKACQDLIRSEEIVRPVSGSLARDVVSGSLVTEKSNHLHCGPNCIKQSGLLKCDRLEFPKPEVFDTVRCHSLNDRGDPIEILSGLYLGNSYHASQDENLRRLGICALLNVAEISNTNNALPSAASDSFCHMNLPIADSSTSDISCKFPQAIEFIENVRLSGGKVLVHCLAGISRSPTICIAYLMYSHNLSLDQAYDLVKQRRSLISPNLNFMRQLFEYERLLISRRQSAAKTDCVKCESPPQISPAPLLPSKSIIPLSNCSNLQQFLSSATKSSQTEDRNMSMNNVVPNVSSRKRPRPDSLSFSIPCSGKQLKSVPYTPCTKQAIFTFDFPSVAVVTASPTVSCSPLCSPT